MDELSEVDRRLTRAVQNLELGAMEWVLLHKYLPGDGVKTKANEHALNGRLDLIR